MADFPASSLASTPLFRSLSHDDAAALSSRMATTAAGPGDTVFLAHEPGDALYVISSGRVRIWVHDADMNDVTLSELGPGDVFGEMAVIDGGRRSANATALEPTTLACLRRETFESFLLDHPPAALALLRGLGARLRHANLLVAQRATRNANTLHEQSLNTLDRMAIAITDRIGSVGFFLIIAGWTVLWTGYNMLASLVPALGWRAFDPFPAFVAYLLMSNVLQIMLMPLIMVGQNLQARHAETRADLDFDTNTKAEKEVAATLLQLERNTDLLLMLMRHVDCRVNDDDMRAIAAERRLTREVGGLTRSAGE